MRNNQAVAICGLHGAGKTTLCGMLLQELAPYGWKGVKNNIYDNIKLVQYRHPEYELHEVGTKTVNYSIPYIWAKVLDYAHYCRHEILPLLESNTAIVADRWSYCYWALAMCQREMYLPVRRFLNLLPAPDLVIYLDVEPEVALNRIRKRGICTPEETIPMLQHLRSAYFEIFEHLDGVRVHTIRSTAIQDNFAEAMDLINQTISKKNKSENYSIY